MPCQTRSSVLVLRIWREADGQPLRARLTWFGEDGLPRSAPIEGSPKAVAAAVEALIEREMRAPQ